MHHHRRIGRFVLAVIGLAIGAALVSSDGGAQAPVTETLTFAAVADTFVDSATANTNYDTDARLRVDADPVRISYLRFAVQGVRGRAITRARLRLYVTGASGASGGRVRTIDSTWNAATLTYATRPPLATPVLSTLGPVAIETTVEFDLASAIAGDGTYSLAIDTVSSDAATYASTAATAAQRPLLVLTVAGGSPPVVAIVEPPDGAGFYRGDVVAFQGAVSDDLDTGLAAALRWDSSRDGFLGTGATISPTLSEGDHAVTASVTDGDGLTGSARVSVSIIPPPPVNTEPLVTITAPLDAQTFTSADAIPFRATAMDLDDGEIAPALTWRSNRDGVIGHGASFAALLSEGSHDVTATVTDSGGLVGAATVQVDVVAPAPLEFGPVADAYVAANEPDRNFGTAGELRLDVDPERIAYLRFTVAGIGSRTVTRARLRMQAAQGFGAASDSGGAIHRISSSAWLETGITYRNRPALDGLPIAAVGPVAPNAIVEYDLSTVVQGDGTYDFALRTPSTDTLTYRSREAGGPLLLVIAEGHAPAVTITRPTSDVEVSVAALPVLLEASAGDLTDGSLDAAIVWTSDRDGILATGRMTQAFLSEGRHRIVASATNSDGATGRDEVSVTITPTAPVVRILQPASGAIVSIVSGVTFRGSATDVTDGDLANAIIWTSSLDGRIGSGGAITATGLTAGVHTITAAATDAGGLTGRATISVTARVGNAPPTIGILSPADGLTFLAGESITFRATASDPEFGDLSGMVSWATSRDGAPPVTLGTGAVLTLATLAPGTHTISAQVIDVEGASAAATVVIAVRDTRLVIRPVEDTHVDADKPTTALGKATLLSVDASPVRQAFLRFAVDGVRPFAVSRAVLRLTVGSESSHASASGGSARVVTDSRWSEGSTTYATRPPTATAVLATAGSAAARAVVELDVNAAVLADGAYEFALTTTSSDAVSYLSREAGTGGPELVLTLARNTPPTVAITAPAAGSAVLAGAPVTLTATATDSEDGDLRPRIAWRSDLDGALGNGPMLIASTLRQGTHTITATVVDSSGADATATLALVVDGAPMVSISAPTPGIVRFTDETITLTGAATDVLDGDLGARLAWNSTLDGALGAGRTLGVRLRAGVHTLTATATDDRGLTGSASVTLSVEVNDPPVVRVLAPADGAHFVAGRNVRLSASAIDPEDGDLASAVTWRSDRDGALGSGADTTTSRLTVGTHRLEATAADRRGLAGAAAITISVEANDAPLVSITAPASGGRTFFGNPVILRGTAADPEDGDRTASIAWSSSRDGALGVGPFIETTTLTRGSHQITARAVDADGLAGTRAITFTVDPLPTGTSAPTVTIVTPANGSTPPAGVPLSFVATARDAEDGDLGARIAWTSNRDGALGTGVGITTIRLALGAHRIRATVTDNHGIVRYAEIGIDVVPGAPTVTIRLPEPYAGFLEGTAVDFFARAEDALDGDVGASLVWSSDRDGAIGTGRTFRSTTLTAGAHTITAAATNTRGLGATAVVQILIGTPTATFAAGADTYVDQGLPTTPLGLESTLLADAGPNVREAYLRFDVANIRGLRIDRARLKLQVARDGRSDSAGIAHTMLGTAWDEATTTWATRPPVDGPAVAVVDAAVDPDDIVEFDVTAALTGEGTYGFAIVSGSEDGVQYRSREAAAGRPQLVVQLGQPPLQEIPTVAIIAPAPGLVVFDDTAVTFRATATDPEDGDLAHAIQWRSDRDGPLGSGATLARRLGRGTHIVTATVTDSFGLDAADGVPITVVDRPPAVTILAPATGAYVPVGFPVVFTASAIDDPDGDLSAAIDWSSSRDGSFGRGASVTFERLSRGDHVITARVVNGLGTEGTAQIALTVDQGPPRVTVLAPAAGTEIGESVSIALTGMAVDLEDGDVSELLAWRSDRDGSLGTGRVVAARLPTVGTHRITAEARDSHGYTGHAETTVVVLPAGPVVTIAAPIAGSTHLGAVGFTGTAIDARDGALSVGLRWTSSLEGALGTGASLPARLLRTGAHVITATATDREGRVGSAQVAIAVGAMPPVVEILSPLGSGGSAAAETTVAAGAPVSFTARAIDTAGTDLGAGVLWRSALTGVLGTGRALTVSTLITGRHFISAEATDRHGLTGSAAIVVVVDVPAGGTTAGTGSAGVAAPAVTITEPAPGLEVSAGAALTLRATAVDRLGTDLAPMVTWMSSLDGFLGEGGTLATTLQAVGSHVVTAVVADAMGLVGSDTMTITVAPPALTVPATADTYVDDAEPSVNFGTAAELRIDASPVRETFLRFVVAGLEGRIVRRAVVRLQVASVATAGSDRGGSLHRVSSGAWTESGLTASNRPVIATTALATAGAVVLGQTIDFDVMAAVGSDGNYDFALRSSSSDLAIYRSREAGIGAPALVLFFAPPPLARPLVTILAPAAGAVLPVGAAADLRATAVDPQDGDVAAGILWRSDVDGLVARGPAVTVALSPGPHVITASANDVDGNTGAARIHVLMGDAPLVEITTPARGASLRYGERALLRATAFDPQEGDLSFAIAWESDVGGPLGVGPAILAALAPGAHTITARVTDAASRVGHAAIAVTVIIEDVGFRDFKFGAGVDEDANRITGAKPESKLWHVDGVWWATLYNSTLGAYTIHRLDLATQHWVDTGVHVDERASSRQDALWDGDHLYLTSRDSAAGGQNRLLRYSYRAAAQLFVLDHGYPAPIPGGGTEALTIAKDSTGILWIAFTLDERVMVSHTRADDTDWAPPFIVPIADEKAAAPVVYFDDITAVQALQDGIGVFWSNQLTREDYFAVRRDGTAPADPASWRLEVAATGGSIADDHLNLKLASDGRLFAAVKTSFTRTATTLIGLLVRTPDGRWSPLHHVADTDFGPTRPLCLLDEVRRRVHVFYSPHEAAIYSKSSDMDTIAFPDPRGVGTPVITSTTAGIINNPSGTKQNVDPSTGFVVLAASTSTYWHNGVDPERAPMVTIGAPSDGTRARLGTPLTFTGTAYSVTDGVIDARLVWTSSIAGRIGAGARVTNVVLPAGEHAISATATDSTLATGHAKITVIVSPQVAPTVTIAAPAAGARLLTDVPVTLTGRAADPLEGSLDTRLAWSSDRDGSLGQGASVTVTSLSPGAHVLTAAATNGASQTGRASIGVDVQRPAPPVIEIDVPAPGTVADFGAIVSFAGRASDAFDGDVTTALRWRSDRDGAIGTGAAFSRASLSFGRHVITATATDRHGLAGTASVVLVIDDLPTVTITGPVENSVFIERTPVTLTAVASDPQDGDVSASIAWRSATDGLLGVGPRLTVSTLSPGEQIITATATDVAGGQASASRRLRVRGYPRVQITTPIDGGSLDPGGPARFVATAIDTEDGNLASRVTWTSDAEGTLGTGAEIITSALVTRGPRTITATVTDNEGFVGSHRITVHVNAAPTVRITAPADGARFDLGRSITFTATATDPEDGDLAATVRWASVVDGPLGTGATLATTVLGAGFQPITATVSDSKGRSASATITIFVNGDPSIAITTPAAGAVLFTNQLPVDFVAVAHDVAGRDIGAGVAWSSTLDGGLGAGAVIRPTVLRVGSHTITATATDASGRTRSANVPITVRAPNAAPAIVITSPTAGTSVPAGTSIALAATAVDDFDGDVATRLTWTSDLGGTLGAGRSLSVTLGEGVHRVVARAVDSDGAAGQAVTTVTIAPTPPLVAIAAPANNAVVFAGSPVTLRGSATDVTDGDLSAALAWSSDRSGALGTGATLSTALAAGTHIVTARAVDRGGLAGSARITIVVDALPSVAIAAPTAGAVVLADRPLVLAALAIDAEDGDLGAALRWESSRDGALGTGAMLTIARLTAGAHTITARATDRHAGTGMTTVGVTVTALVRPIVASADTYVDASAPSTTTGNEDTFRIDADPVRQALLRFPVAGLAPFRIEAVSLRLTVGPLSSHSGDAGGTLHVVRDTAWSESTTYATRPAIDGPALGTLGAVDVGDTVRFNVSSIVAGEGSYDFALVSASADGVGYRSSEASKSRPTLDVTLAQDLPPAVLITAPLPGASIPSGASITFQARATDAEDGDLGAGVVWTSDVKGPLGRGAQVMVPLGSGRHTITAVATDHAGQIARATLVIDVGAGTP